MAVCTAANSSLGFMAEAAAVIRDRVSADHRIEITMADGARLAASAVAIGDAVVLVDDCSDALRRRLQERCYRVIGTPLSGFRRSGGAAFCLTLRLDGRSGVADAGMRAVAAGR
jgi:N-dimethylarginine dimethylaminohydrolase